MGVTDVFGSAVVNRLRFFEKDLNVGEAILDFFNLHRRVNEVVRTLPYFGYTAALGKRLIFAGS